MIFAHATQSPRYTRHTLQSRLSTRCPAPTCPQLFQEMLGDVLALSSPAESLAAYQAALALHRGAGAVASPSTGLAPRAANVSARLLNNAAVMHYRASLVDEARVLIKQAIDKLSSGSGAFVQLDLQCSSLIYGCPCRTCRSHPHARFALACHCRPALFFRFPPPPPPPPHSRNVS
jgi:hypothetical protein